MAFRRESCNNVVKNHGSVDEHFIVLLLMVNLDAFRGDRTERMIGYPFIIY